MEITKLTAAGQVTIPEALREKFQWQYGQELVIINFGDGILIKPKKCAPVTTLEEVGGCLNYQGEAKTIEEMEEGVNQGMLELWQK